MVNPAAPNCWTTPFNCLHPNSTGVIFQQMSLVQNKKLYDHAESIMSIAIASTERYEVLRNELLNDGDIEEVTLAVALPRLPHIHPLSASLTFPELNDQVHNWKRRGGDYNFPEMFGLKLIAGRSFDEQNVSSSSNYIINQAAVQLLNTPLLMKLSAIQFRILLPKSSAV